MPIHTIGVLGAGVMGIGVAQNLAQTNHQVILIDISDESLARAQDKIKENLRFVGLFRKKPLHEEIAQIMPRITFTTDYSPLANVDLVIENVPEKWDVKQPVYTRIDAICQPHCIFAANTSALSITRLAGITQRPDRVIGLHFMNPVPQKPVVEVVRGYHTSEETLATAQLLLRQMGKESIVVNDMPGFVSNRVLMLTINEAICLIQDQVASVTDVDTIFKKCFGHTMGPLETADLIGLDTILYSLEVLYESYHDIKYRPCPLLQKMVYAGLYGQKSGQGFYAYA